MKKTLLFMGLLGFAASARAQTPIVMGPWTQVNTVGYGTFAPGYDVVNIATASPTICWALTEEYSATTNTPANTYLVTNNAAGTQFDFGPISAPTGNQAYETANIAPVGVSATTAIAGNYGANGGGEILRTTNAGASWTKVLTFANSSSFLDFVHMFNSLDGVAVGDPTLGYFEIYTTSNGGVSWTRVPQANIPPVLNTREYGLVRSFFAQGNTIWFAGASSQATDPVRIFKSTDKGVTWTASPVTALLGSVHRLAFKDASNGIAYNYDVDATTGAVTAIHMISTSNGGATWSPITPVNSAAGSFYRTDIDGVNGAYYSVGVRFPRASPSVIADFGSSYSTDGINWRNITNINALANNQIFLTLDLIASGTGAVGYAGSFTDGQGAGGVYQSNRVITSTTRDVALQSELGVYPNPSASGIFTVDLGSSLKAGAQLTVTDALGRQVKSQVLNATTVGAKKFNLDLSGEKTGIYTLQIRTDNGIATQKVVIE
ncbi:T9SS type A sorting domain-containing protein [Hymenobacter rubidus]|uniref:T9SS type A sorting domain-containing protein n=1 Tax=Hymenobacter rubidus TaxID=1441626 RepID=UPI00191FC9C2|nr:T9SS type A sorting domain-containing protein [Hymenobacter rubidus]